MKIETRLQLFAPTLMLFTALLVGSAIYWGYGRLLAEERINELASEVMAKRNRVAVALDSFLDDVTFLSQLPTIEALASLDESDREAHLDRVVGEFVALLAARPAYDQIRVIGIADGGREVVRIQRGDAGPLRVAEHALQQKSGQDYFREIMRYAPGAIYVSRVTLNREHGEIEQPYRPMLRIGTPLYAEAARPFGFLIINVDFEAFVQTYVGADNSQKSHYITNDEGDFLVHPDASRTFGFEFGQRHLLQEEIAGLAPAFVRSGESAASATARLPQFGQRALVLVERFYPFRSAPTRSMSLAIAIPIEALPAPWQGLVSTLTVILLALFALSALTGSLMATRLARPLAELTSTAEQIASGERVDFRYADRSDEVGVLSRALESMVGNLEEKQVALADACSDLEHFSELVASGIDEQARQVAASIDRLASANFSQEDNGRERQLGSLRQEADSLSQHIQDLSKFGRLVQPGARREDTDLAQIVETVVNDQHVASLLRDIEVEVDSMPSKNVYPGLVAHLFSMLIALVVEVSGENLSRLHFSCRTHGDRFELGMGDPLAELQPLAFRPMSMHPALSGRSTRVVIGMIERIVARHAGQITAAIENKKLSFRFTLSGSSSHAAGS